MSEINQIKSGRGGARKGAGRKPGSVTQKTREIAERAAAEGITPLEYLLSVVRDEGTDRRERMQAAMAAAPYVHPRLSAVAHTGEGGGPIEHAHTILEVRGVAAHQG